MDKNKKTEETLDNLRDKETDTPDLMEDSAAGSQDENENKDNENIELDNVRTQLDAKTKQCEEYYNLAQRIAAEFDNYKKRTSREREAFYSETVSEVVSAFLPVVDNMERALQASSKDVESQSLREGIDLVYRQLKGVLKNLGVEEIKGVGEKFDPQLHNAVMHIDDDSYDESIIVEEFQKGYLVKDKVIRHSMVKVAN